MKTTSEAINIEDFSREQLAALVEYRGNVIKAMDARIAVIVEKLDKGTCTAKDLGDYYQWREGMFSALGEAEDNIANNKFAALN